MSKVAPYQTDFSAGEISPRLRGKIDSPLYSAGLAKCDNFEVTPQGSLRVRAGTKFVATIDETEAVLHTFRRDIDRDVIVVVGEEKIRLFNRSGPVLNSPGAGSMFNLISDPNFTLGLFEWEEMNNTKGSTRTETIPGESATLSYFTNTDIGGGFEFAEGDLTISQGMTTTPGDSYLFEADLIVNIEDFLLVLLGSVEVLVTVKILDADDPFIELFSFQELTLVTDPPGEPSLGPVPKILSGGFDAVSSGITLLYSLSVVLPSGNLVTGGPLSSRVTIATQAITPTTIPAPAEFNTPDSWKNTPEFPRRLNLIHSCVDSAKGEMYFTVFGGLMHRLRLDESLSTPWIFEQFIPGVTPDPDREFDADDQPSVCTIHQGRLWLAASPLNKSTVWGSETFNYDLFAVGPLAADPVEFELASRGAIQWLEGLKFLLIGTDLGETIGRSTGPVITGSDFDFPREQTWGSTRVQPAEVGGEALYITSDRSKVRSLYDGGDAANGYESAEVTFFAEHLVRRRIRDIMYAQNPHYQLSCLLSTGDIAVATLFAAVKINAWYTMTMDDSIISIETSNDGLGTSGWYLVKRTADKVPYLALEVKNADNAAGYNSDSHVLRRPDSAGIVTGLDHLNGYDCSVVMLRKSETTDNIVYTIHPNRTPVNGQITVEDFAINEAVMIGIPFVATAVTLPLEGSNPLGTAQVQKRRNNQIFLRLIDSVPPKVNGQFPADHDPVTPMGLSPELVSTDVVVTDLNTKDGVVTIVQDLPVPTHITAIYLKSKGDAT